MARAGAAVNRQSEEQRVCRIVRSPRTRRTGSTPRARGGRNAEYFSPRRIPPRLRREMSGPSGWIVKPGQAWRLPAKKVMAHVFLSHLDWSGAAKGPTRDATAFSRNPGQSIDGITLPMSSAPGFGGNAMRAKPGQLYVAALSACQALLSCSRRARPRVRDRILRRCRRRAGDGRWCLPHGDREAAAAHHPWAGRSVLAEAQALVEKAHQQCFIGNSVSAKVDIGPVIQSRGTGCCVMMSFERILCPVDFSDPSRRALNYAAALSRWHGAPLTVLHAPSACRSSKSQVRSVRWVHLR